MRPRPALCALALAAMFAAGLTRAGATPIITTEGVLPQGTELYQDQLDQPTELFYSEAGGGQRPYLSKLGDMLFSSPGIFGGVARQAGISCATCHRQGHNNPKLFIPGLSGRPGTFHTSNVLFNPHAQPGKFDPMTPPSLRGARNLAPYAHDGRFATLRDFIRNAVVNEFAGPEPSRQIVDALEAYINDIAFLPNGQLAGGGRLSDSAPEPARRGEAVFERPFRRDASLSCATCHKPGSNFVDHAVHDVGSGGAYKTPTLRNANFSAPYFHDGRFGSYGEVVEYFDRHYDLGLAASERADLVAYLDAVGDADQPLTRNTVQAELDEIATFASVLDTAIPARNHEVIALTLDTVGNEWRELGENFPEAKNSTIKQGLPQRLRAAGTVRGLVLRLREMAMAAADNDFAGLARDYADYRAAVETAAPVLKQAEPFSLFDPQVRAAHFSALRQLSGLSTGGMVKR